MKKYFKAALVCSLFVLAACGDDAWEKTASGAIKLTEYDRINGRINIKESRADDKKVCQSYVNPLATGEDGIDGATLGPKGYRSLDSYYFYEVTSTIDFYIRNEVDFKLTLYESPKFFKEPKVIITSKDLADKADIKSVFGTPPTLGLQIKILDVFKDEKGAPRPVSLTSAANSMKEIYGGDTNFKEWLVRNFADKNTKDFMGCVANAYNLDEVIFDVKSRKTIENELVKAEKDLQRLIKKLQKLTKTTITIG